MTPAMLILAAIALFMTGMAVVQMREAEKYRLRLDEQNRRRRGVSVSEETVEALEKQLEAAYQEKIRDAAKTLGEQLQTTSSKLGEQVSRLSAEVIEQELTAFRQTLDQARQQAAESTAKIQAELENQRAELKSGLDAEMASERAKLTAKLDDRLNDVVGSYIVEALGGGVDLGAQMQYIIDSLQAQKTAIKKDLEE